MCHVAVTIFREDKGLFIQVADGGPLRVWSIIEKTTLSIIKFYMIGAVTAFIHNRSPSVSGLRPRLYSLVASLVKEFDDLVASGRIDYAHNAAFLQFLPRGTYGWNSYSNYLPSCVGSTPTDLLDHVATNLVNDLLLYLLLDHKS